MAERRDQRQPTTMSTSLTRESIREGVLRSDGDGDVRFDWHRPTGGEEQSRGQTVAAEGSVSRSECQSVGLAFESGRARNECDVSGGLSPPVAPRETSVAQVGGEVGFDAATYHETLDAESDKAMDRVGRTVSDSQSIVSDDLIRELSIQMSEKENTRRDSVEKCSGNDSSVSKEFVEEGAGPVDSESTPAEDPDSEESEISSSSEASGDGDSDSLSDSEDVDPSTSESEGSASTGRVDPDSTVSGSTENPCRDGGGAEVSDARHPPLDSYRKDPDVLREGPRRRRNLESSRCERDDFLIPRLFRVVIDETLSGSRLRESDVTRAIGAMKSGMAMAHKRAFRTFPGVDFDDPASCCGYLRRYAACHAGLVKEALWDFLVDTRPRCRDFRLQVFGRSRLKVAALGGGPGNDLVGLCSALHEAQYVPEAVDLTVVDVHRGWAGFFPRIVRAARRGGDFGSFGAFVRGVRVSAEFVAADLTDPELFSDAGRRPAALAEADVVLMVKLMSFMSKRDGAACLLNVVGAMKAGAALVFLDAPFPEKLFRDLKGRLRRMYAAQDIEYKFRFRPSKYHSPCIPSTHAHLYIYSKRGRTSCC